MRLIPRRRADDEAPRRRRFRRARRAPEGSMTLLEHLEELRSRLIWVIATVGLAAVAGWFLFDPVVRALLKPARPYLTTITHGQLIVTSPLEAFTLRFKISFVIGFVIAFPVVLYHVWRFVAPGLHKNEKKYAVPFIAAGMVLFGVGVWFGIFTLPEALKFLIGPGITGAAISPVLAARNYVEFGILYLVAFGLSFEFPVVLMLLTLTRVLSSRSMARYRRHVFMGIAVVVAVVTPSVDWFSMTVLTIALYVLFEASIWLSRLLRR